MAAANRLSDATNRHFAVLKRRARFLSPLFYLLRSGCTQIVVYSFLVKFNNTFNVAAVTVIAVFLPVKFEKRSSLSQFLCAFFVWRRHFSFVSYVSRSTFFMK